MHHPTLSPAAGSRRHHVIVVTLLVAALIGLGVHQAPPARGAEAAKIAPALALAGTGVTISGVGLLDVTGVTFLGADGPADDVAASHFIVLDAKKVVAQIPPGAVSGPVRVDTPQGPATTPVPVTILDPPSITSISDASGSAGQIITITGENLTGTKKPKIFFGAKGVGPLTMSSTELTVAVPALTGGAVDLTVLTNGGSATGTFYIAPTVKGVAPAVGTTAGGTIATIAGSALSGVDNFVDDPATPAVNEAFDGVTIGGTRVTGLLAVSDKEVVVEVPPGTDPAAPVVVKTRPTVGSVVGVAPTTPTFKYQPLPAVTSVSPDWNAVGDPQPITLTGTNLTETTAVLVNGGAPADVTVDTTAGTMTFTPPASVKPGPAKVALTNDDNGVLLNALAPFSYVTTPTVAKLVPSSAPAGTMVTVSGTNFASNTTVTFGATTAQCTVLTLAAMTCKAPTGAGGVEVTATNSVGSSPSVATSTFTYTEGTPPAFVNKLAPVPAAILPAHGAVGSTVALKGANLDTVSKMEFTGEDDTWIEAPEFLRVSAKRLVVKVPAGAVTGELRIRNSHGRVESKTRMTMSKRPDVTGIDVVGDATFGVEPTDLLKITGTGLFIKKIKTLVTIGGKPASVLAKPRPTAKTIVVKVPSDIGGRREVVVTTPLGTSTAEVAAYFVPEVKAIKPETNSRSGGVIATITGNGFTGTDNVTIGAGHRQAVTFRGIPVAKFVFMSDKSLVAVTAPGSATADDLVVTTQHDGRVGNSDSRVRSVSAPVPSISTVTPDTGPTSAAPPVVTITGVNLKVNSTVKFGAAVGTVQSAAPDGTSLNVLPPTRTSAATVAVSVTNVDDGEELTATKPAAYSYILLPATVTGMSAATALPGTPVTLTGTGFVDVESVKFGAVSVSYTVANDNTLFTTVPLTPSGARGTVVDVTVVNGTGTPSSGNPATADDWTWDSHPMITSMSMATANAGTTVTINGVGFTGATAVRFGSSPATYTVVSDTQITATVPTSPEVGGKVDVVVDAAGLTSPQPLVPSADDWTWVPRAVVTQLSPQTSAAGSTVTVTGQNFTGTTSVYINQDGNIHPATSFTVVNNTTLTFVVPPRPGGQAGLRTNKPLYIVNGSGADSIANPVGANLFTWS